MSCKECGHHAHNCKCKCKELDKCRCDVEINSLDCIRVQQDFSCLGIKKGDKMTKLILELASKACNPLVPLPGKNGVGIASTSYNPVTGVLTLTYTNGSTFDTEDLRGEQGEIGVGIESTSYDGGTGELTLNYTDGSSFTTDDLRGPTGDPGPNQLLIQNSLIVTKNGNDGTGTRNDWAKPFLTIQAANAAALSGDIIIVFPGSYSVGGSAMNKNGVSYYFYKGASVVSTSNLIVDNGLAVSINIFGEGDFNSTGNRVLFTTNSGTIINFTFNQAVGFFDSLTIGDANTVYIRGKYAKAFTQYTASIRGNCTGIMDIDVYDGSAATLIAETVGFRNHSTDTVSRMFEIRGKILSNTANISGSLTITNSPGLRLIAEHVEIIHDSGVLTGEVGALVHTSGLVKFGGMINSTSNAGVIVSSDGSGPAVLLLKGATVNSEYTALQVNGSVFESVEVDGCSLTKGTNQNLPAVYMSSNGTISELEIRNTVIINEGTGDEDHGIYTEDDLTTVRLDNVKVTLEAGSLASSIKSGITRTVNVESVFSSNFPFDATVTNGVTGSLVVIDSSIQSNTLKFK